MDVFRCPQNALSSAFQPIGSFPDKLLVGKLRLNALKLTEDEIQAIEDCSTEDYLRSLGFSDSMLDAFFRTFYGGIFLERELQTSCRMFLFTFKMFAQGFATLPAEGMQAIPNQLANRLPSDSIRLHTPVTSVSPHCVTLRSAETLDAKTVVIATDAESAGRLVPNLPRTKVGWRSVTTLSFAAEESPLKEAIIALNGENDGLINHICVPSDVAPTYAPENRSLVSVTLLGHHESADLEESVRAELLSWFGDDAETWQHLRTHSIRKALPEQLPGKNGNEDAPFTHEGFFVCGDYCETASIEGAIRSGIRCAEAIRQH